MITLGFVLAVAIPLAVVVGAIVWPERIPQDRTVDGIRQRIEREAKRQKGRRGATRSPVRSPNR